MSVFTIVRNHRQSESESSGEAKTYRSSTKNNIHHFAAILKRLLTVKCQEGRIRKDEAARISHKLTRATSLASFVDGYAAIHIRKIFLESCENGKFMQLLMTSEIEPENKSILLSYVNVLMNSFISGRLERWILQEVKADDTDSISENSFQSQKKSTSSMKTRSSSQSEEYSSSEYIECSRSAEVSMEEGQDYSKSVDTNSDHVFEASYPTWTEEPWEYPRYEVEGTEYPGEPTFEVKGVEFNRMIADPELEAYAFSEFCC